MYSAVSSEFNFAHLLAEKIAEHESETLQVYVRFFFNFVQPQTKVCDLVFYFVMHCKSHKLGLDTPSRQINSICYEPIMIGIVFIYSCKCLSKACFALVCPVNLYCNHLPAVAPAVLVFAYVFPVNLTCINTAAS